MPGTRLRSSVREGFEGTRPECPRIFGFRGFSFQNWILTPPWIWRAGPQAVKEP